MSYGRRRAYIPKAIPTYVALIDPASWESSISMHHYISEEEKSTSIIILSMSYTYNRMSTRFFVNKLRSECLRNLWHVWCTLRTDTYIRSRRWHKKILLPQGLDALLITIVKATYMDILDTQGKQRCDLSNKHDAAQQLSYVLLETILHSIISAQTWALVPWKREPSRSKTHMRTEAHKNWRCSLSREHA